MNILIYLFKANLVLIVCWVLYRAAFRKLTFFQWNRIYLMASAVLSLILPLLKLQWSNSMAVVADLEGIDWIYMDHLAHEAVVRSVRSVTWSPWSVLLAIYLLIAVGFLLKSALQYRQLDRSTKGARRIRTGRVNIYVQDQRAGSFTLFRNIYLDRFAYANNLRPVLNHELVHAGQLHSLDLLFMEFLVALLWFNPLVFMFRRAVRENHEYLADHQAQADQGSLTEYLECLKAETIRYFSPVPASYFKSSTIKKRIIMLTTHKSKQHKKWRYLGILPLMALIIILFHTPAEQGRAESAAGSTGSPAVNIPLYIPDGIPSQFPLPLEYMEKVTWGYHQEAVHPITRKKTTHLGIDVAAPRGTRVFASGDGTVIKAMEEKGWGKLVVVEHAEGYTSFYAHLDEIKVADGVRVKEGEVIGLVGSTGQSTGPHLHYEVRRMGEHLNPADFY